MYELKPGNGYEFPSKGDVVTVKVKAFSENGKRLSLSNYLGEYNK